MEKEKAKGEAYEHFFCIERFYLTAEGFHIIIGENVSIKK